MLTFCLMAFFQYAQCQWIDPKCNHKVIIARETMGISILMLTWGWKKKLNLIKKLRSNFFLYLPKKVFFSSNFSNTKHLPRSTVVRDDGANPMFLCRLHYIFTFGNMALDKVP